MDWDALERTGEDRLVELISTTWRDIARDHRATFRMLALHPPVEHILNSGEPEHTDHNDDNAAGHDDPTGETAIRSNTAIRRQGFYSELLAETYARVIVLDSMRRQMMPATKAPTISDDNWCKNCITVGVCNPRKSGRHYCWWCELVRQTYGAHPPHEIIRIRDETGDSHRVTKALADWNPKAKGRR